MVEILSVTVCYSGLASVQIGLRDAIPPCGPEKEESTEALPPIVDEVLHGLRLGYDGDGGI